MSMLKTKLLLVVGSILIFTGCGASDKVSELKDKANVQDIAGKTEQAKNIIANIGPFKDNLLGMKDTVGQTLTAVKSGDFTTAQTEFGKLQTSWSKIEGDIKTISTESHQNIQADINNVASDLQASNPDKTQLTEDLENLTGSLGNLAVGGGGAELDPETEANTTDVSNDTADSSGQDTVQSNLIAMKDSVAEASSALESDDIASAKTSFSDARQSWFKFGGSVKQSSAETYQTIDEGVKSIHSSLNSEAPSQDTLLTEIGSLSQSLEEVSP